MSTVDILREYVSRELLGGRRTPSDAEDLLASDLIDSIGVMRLVAFLEETFHFQVSPEDVTIESFQSLDTIAAYVDRNRG
ncbi:MAG: acyl carrier protein [bacterium]